MATELGHSLWLAPPPGPVRDQLDLIISQLAAEHNSPIFVPHITLAPDVSFSQFSSQQIVEFVQTLATQISAFPITCKFIEGVPDSLYQCLYVKCDLSDQLLSAVNLTRGLLGRDVNNPPFKPHMSICYQPTLTKDVKAQIATVYDPSIRDLSFIASGIQIWTNGEPISAWSQVGPEIPFHA